MSKQWTDAAARQEGANRLQLQKDLITQQEGATILPARRLLPGKCDQDAGKLRLRCKEGATVDEEVATKREEGAILCQEGTTTCMYRTRKARPLKKGEGAITRPRKARLFSQYKKGATEFVECAIMQQNNAATEHRSKPRMNTSSY